MVKMQKKLEGLGKKIDDSLTGVKEKSKEAGKAVAKAAVRKSVQGAASVAMSVGKGVEAQVRNYSKKAKAEMGIREGMTAGEKTGAVVGKVVDFIGVGIGKIADKLEEKQSKRFANPTELKVEGYDVLIGENLNSAIGVNRAARCKEFVKQMQADKKTLPYQLKDMRKAILSDIIISASTDFEELLYHLKNREDLLTKAEINYLTKEIKIIEQKIKGEGIGTKN